MLQAWAKQGGEKVTAARARVARAAATLKLCRRYVLKRPSRIMKRSG
jgi:hypothetical protein